MPIDPELLNIIRCPITKVSLRLLTAEQLDTLNERISSDSVRYADGSAVEAKLAEGLITETGTTIYRIDAGIPVMIEDRSIPAGALELNAKA